MPELDPPDDPLPLIGWKEWVTLPGLGVGPLLSKSDSGAATSAIDCTNIRRRRGRRVAFTLFTRRGKSPVSHDLETDIIRTAEVRSSNGELQERIVIATPIRVGPHEFLTELTLVDRHRLSCRMLLGRAAMADRFYVDSANDYLLTPRKRKAATEWYERHVEGESSSGDAQGERPA